jgi:hypothetical protein
VTDWHLRLHQATFSALFGHLCRHLTHPVRYRAGVSLRHP